MFGSNPYLSVNREERFYCFLFGHALLASLSYRGRIVTLLNRRLDAQLDASALEVYIEVAALRDFWNGLGNSRKYTAETHEKRRVVLNTILEMEGVDPKVIDDNAVFWTGEPGSKLWSPGRWNMKKLEESNLPQLKRIRWAFNAKPDMLLLSPNAGIVIEAKLESGEGRLEETGYDQIGTQRLIISLWKELIPSFARVHEEPTTLKLTNGVNGLTWGEVIPVKSDAGVDEFTRRGLAALRRYAHLGRPA